MHVGPVHCDRSHIQTKPPVGVEVHVPPLAHGLGRHEAAELNRKKSNLCEILEKDNECFYCDALTLYQVSCSSHDILYFFVYKGHQ